MPGFGHLGGELLHAAVTGGVEDPEVTVYLDSILEFAAGDDARLAGLRRHVHHRRLPDYRGGYPHDHAPSNEALTQEEGLRTVLEACDELEDQVSRPAGCARASRRTCS